MTFKNGWNTKPSWLKGGFIGLFVAIIVLLIHLFLYNVFRIQILEVVIFPGFLSFILTSKFGCKFLDMNWDGSRPLYCDRLEFISTVVTLMIVYFLIGAFIGFVIGKIKSKKQ